jgi:hypothetical protein
MLDQFNGAQIALAFIAGTIAKAVGTGIVEYFRSTLIPYLADRTYRHIDLSDKDWRIVHAGSPINGEKLESEWKTSICIRQTGDKIKGEATTSCTKGSKMGTQRNFDVTGTVNNGIVLLSMRNKDRSIKSHSAFLLQVVGEGNVLQGYRLFYGMNRNEINGTRCNIIRGNHQPKGGCGPG